MENSSLILHLYESSLFVKRDFWFIWVIWLFCFRTDCAEWFDVDVIWCWKSVKSGPFSLTFLLQCLIKLSDSTWMWLEIENQWKVAPFHWLFCFSFWLSWVIWRGCDLKLKISEKWPLFTDFSASAADWAEWSYMNVVWSRKLVKGWPPFSDFSSSASDWAEWLMRKWFEAENQLRDGPLFTDFSASGCLGNKAEWLRMSKLDWLSPWVGVE